MSWQNRCVLTRLRNFTFKGIKEYLEGLLARIDPPGLFRLWILFFDDIDFDTSQLIQFVGRTLTFKPFNEAHVTFRRTDSQFQLRSQESNLEMVRVDISCRETNWQLSTLAQICTSFSPHLSAAESLYIHEGFHSKPDWSDVENTEWLEVLFPFTAVKNLYISKKFGHVSPPLCKSSPRVEWQQCCPPFRIFSWRGSSHQNLSRKALGGSFLADSSPITLLPSLPGTETRYENWRTMIDVYPLLSTFCPVYFLCCRPYYVPLHLLLVPETSSYAILLTITHDVISLYVYMLSRRRGRRLYRMRPTCINYLTSAARTFST